MIKMEAQNTMCITDKESSRFKEFEGQFQGRDNEKNRRTVRFTTANITHSHPNSIQQNFRAEQICDVHKKSRKLKKTKKKIKRFEKENLFLYNQLEKNEKTYFKRIKESQNILETVNKYNEQLEKENRFLKKQHKGMLEILSKCKAELKEVKKSECSIKKSFDSIATNLEFYKKKNQDLETDVGMLKIIVLRLNVHLEYYQEKLRDVNKHAVNSKRMTPDKLKNLDNEVFLDEFHQDHKHVPIAWGKVNAHTLGPLLNAYQEQILDKKTLIKEYEEEMAKITFELKQIIDENTLLHRQLTEDEHCSTQLQTKLNSQTIELESIKEQNALLSKKCTLKQNKIDDIMELFQQKVQQMKRDHNILLKEYQKCRMEIKYLEEENRRLIAIQEQRKIITKNMVPATIDESNVMEEKCFHEELKAQNENEKIKLSSNVTALSNEMDNLKRQILILDTEKTQLEKKLQGIEFNVKNLKKKYRELKYIIHNLHGDKNALKKHLHKTVNFARELLQEKEIKKN